MLARWRGWRGESGGRRSRGHRADLCRPAGRGRATASTCWPATSRWRRPRWSRRRSGTPTRRCPQDRVTAWSATSYAAFAGLADRARAPASGCCPAPRCSTGRTDGPLVGRRGARPGPRRLRRPGTPTPGRSPRRSSTCRSTCAGCVPGSTELGGTLTRIEPGRAAAARRRRGGQLRRARLPPAGRRPGRAPGPGPGGAVERRRRSTGGGWTRPGRRTSCPRRERRGRRHRRGRRLEPHAVAGDGGRDPRAGRPGWSPARRAPGWSATGSGCARCGSAVRLEAEGRVVHCYGQGGAGVTLSWGCADEVVQVARCEAMRARS